MNPNNNQAAWKGIYDTLGNISKSLGELNTGGPTKSSGSGGTKNTNQGLLDALTERLTSQGKGIVSSSTSGLQDALSGAISDTQKSGDLTRQALQSEREREVSFAQDRAAAQYTNALESRSGFATMTYGLRELTETTEKSIRDLDKRYQEAILTNDAATAKTVAELRMKKLEFQQEQEQNYFNNLMQAAGMIQNEQQFFANYEQKEQQFAAQLAQSNYQFDKNLGISLQELGLKKDQLDIDRARLNLSEKEYNLRAKQIADEKSFTMTTALVTNRLRAMQSAGISISKEDQLQLANDLRAEVESQGFTFDGSTEEWSKLVSDSISTVSAEYVAPTYETYRAGGALSLPNLGNLPVYPGISDYTYSQLGGDVNKLIDWAFGAKQQRQTN